MRRFLSFSLIVGAVCAMAPGCGGAEDGQHDALSDAGGGTSCVACPGADASSTALINPTPQDIARCAMLDPGQCATDPACTPMYGLAYDKAQHCRAAGSIAVGCRALGQGCGGGYTLAIDARGGQWRLENVCLPAGWTHAPEEPQPPRWVEDFPVCASAQVEASCAMLNTQAACAAQSACYAVGALRLNEYRRCKEGSSQFVGCTQNKGCNGLSTLAKDLSGGSWELPGVCVPLGWTVLPNTESNSVRHDWPACR